MTLPARTAKPRPLTGGEAAMALDATGQESKDENAQWGNIAADRLRSLVERIERLAVGRKGERHAEPLLHRHPERELLTGMGDRLQVDHRHRRVLREALHDAVAAL